METKRIFIILIIAVSILTINSASYAQEVAVSVNSKNVALNDLLNSVVPPLTPLLQQNGSSINIINQGAVFAIDDPDNLKDRFMNMFINAVAHAPKSAKITLGYDQGNRTIFLRVPNENIRFEVDRQIKDMKGNIYNLKTIKGKEAVYSMII